MKSMCEIPLTSLNKDTAQAYRNEKEAGLALKESGLSRSDVFITTKWSGVDGLDVATSIRNSVSNVFFRQCFLFVFFEDINSSASIMWTFTLSTVRALLSPT